MTVTLPTGDLVREPEEVVADDSGGEAVEPAPPAGFVARNRLLLIALVLVLFVIARIIGGRGPGHISLTRRWRLARKGLA